MWQLRVELTKADKTEVNRLATRYWRVLAWFMLALGLYNIRYGVVFIVDGGMRWQNTGQITLIVVASMMCIVPTIMWWPGSLGTLGLLLTPPRDYILSISENGMEVDRLFGEEPDVFHWTSFRSLHETPNLWVLKERVPKKRRFPDGSPQYLVIPKRSVPQEQAALFRGFLTEHIAKR